MNRTIRVFTDVPHTWMPCEQQRLPPDESADSARGIPGCWRLVLSGSCDPGPEPWRQHFASNVQLVADMLFGLLGPAGDVEPRIWLFCPSIPERDAMGIRANLPSATSIACTHGIHRDASDPDITSVGLLARLISAAELVASGWHDMYLRCLPTSFFAFSSDMGDVERSFESLHENLSHESHGNLPACPYTPESFARLLDEADYVAQCWDFDSPDALVYSQRLPAQGAMDAIREHACSAGWGVDVERLSEHGYFDWLTGKAGQ